MTNRQYYQRLVRRLQQRLAEALPEHIEGVRMDLQLAQECLAWYARERHGPKPERVGELA
jgi:hypothetical protein